MNTFKEDIEEIRRSYNKIKFDIYSLKNIQKLREVYNVQTGESIIAYIKSRVMFVPLSISGIIITDMALYRHPSIFNKEHNRFSFSELCSYIIVQKYETDSISAINSKGEFEVWGDTLIGKNEAGAELKSFLYDLKNHMVNKYSWAREQRISAVRDLLNQTREQMRYKEISKNILYALDNIAEENLYKRETILLKSECLFRVCQQEKLDEFIEYVYKNINSDLANDIKNKTSDFFTAMKYDIQNYMFEPETQYLKDILNRISEDGIFAYFIPYISIRLWKYTDYEEKKSVYVKKYGKKAAEDLDLFMGCYKNFHMQKIYEKIQKGKMPDDICLSWSDSIGFTALHYAMILQQKNIIDEIVEKKSKYFITSNEDNIKDIIHNYNVLAAYLHIQNREKICYALSKEIKAVEKQILLQKAKILKIKKDIYIYEQSTEIRGRYERYAMISIEQGHEPIDYRELNNCRCELEAAEQALENLQCNIYEIINREMRDATEKAEYIRCNNGIFLTLIRSIYSNADFLYRVISSSSGKYKLYIYKDMNFVLPEELPIDFKNDEEHTNYKKRCNNNTQIPNNQSKVHIVSWFSKKAHLDKNILRKEYRILSKQYHPDSKNAKSDSKTFSDISNEYNKILKNI